jgi:hypothetical protein
MRMNGGKDGDRDGYWRSSWRDRHEKRGRGGGGAVAGALFGGFGTYLFEVGDGNCQYRNSKGRVYTRRCHWL